MSGMLAPTVATYQYQVDNMFSKYVNVSFPFRVRITDVWFTADRALLGSVNDWASMENDFRVLALAGIKSKNPKKVLSSYDVPTDWAPFFGYATPDSQEGWTGGDAEFKPQIWLGVPDEATADQLKNQSTQYAGTPFFGAGFRSSSSKPPSLNQAHNPYWGNNGWSTLQFAANKYKTDMGVMNPDEMVSLFLYNESGNWEDYDGTGIATIHIAYEGVGYSTQPGDQATPWNDWFYD